MDIEQAPEIQKQDGHQPGEPEIGDAIIPPAGKPEGKTEGADERVHPTNVLPVAPQSVEGGEEAIISQQDGEQKEKESVDVIVSKLASDVSMNVIQ